MKPGGDAMSKFCGLGQAGFPHEVLKCRQISGSPLNLTPPRYRQRGLITT